MRRRRLLVAAAVIAGLAAGAGGTFAAFRATAANSGDAVAAGTVALTDNDSGSSMFSLSGLKAYDTSTKCIKVTNSGSLASHVRLYGSTSGTGLDRYVSAVITRGSYSTDPGFSSCSNFVPDSTNYISGQANGVIYSGTLQGFPTSYATGIDDPSSSSVDDWVPNETHVYKIDLTVGDQDAAASKNATQMFTWEARNTSGYKGTILSTSGLQSYWRFGESSGTTAKDMVGGKDGTYTNGPVLGQAGAIAGDTDTAASFDGSNDFVGFGDNYGFAGTGSFSAEAWVNQSITHSWSARIFDKVNYGTNRDGWLLVNQATDSLAFIRYSGSATAGTSVSGAVGLVAAGNGWHHVVATYDGTNMRLYVDGVLRGGPSSSTYAMNAHTSALAVGAQSGGSNPFPGLIDDAAIYNVALTAQQVQDHYQSGLTGN